MDNAAIGLKMRIASESSAGGGGTANKILRYMRLPLQSAWENLGEFKSEGNYLVEGVQPGDELASGDASSVLSFTESCYVYESALQKLADPTVGPGGSYTRLYTNPTVGVDSRRTYTVEKTNARMTLKYNHVVATGFTVSQTRQAATMTAPFIGQLAQVLTEPTSPSPAKVASVRVIPVQTGLFYSEVSMDDLDVAPIRMTRNFEFGFGMGGFLAPFYPMNELLRSFGGVVEQEDVDATATLRLGTDVATPNTVPARANTTVYVAGDYVKRAGGTHTVVFKARVGGTSAASEPAAMATAVHGTSITDGTVEWLAVNFDVRAPFSMADTREGKTFWIRCRSIGPVIDVASSTYYLHQVDLAVQAIAPLQFDAERGLMVRPLSLRIVDDEVEGVGMKIKVVNKLAVV
jgi:hypothetical protein